MEASVCRRNTSILNVDEKYLLFWGGGSRAALRHLGPAHLESPGPGPEFPLTGGDFADHRQAEDRWSRLNRGLASSRPWLLQVGRRCPRPGRHKPPGFARAVAGPPLLSHGDTTLPLSPLSHMVPVSCLMKPQRPSPHCHRAQS